MSMVTHCPSCATTFRVTPQDLQAHSGQVRCGRCSVVFDAFSNLTSLSEDEVLVANIDTEHETSVAETEPELIEPVADQQVVTAIEETVFESPVATSVFLEIKPKKKRWPWAIGVLILLMLLTLQGVYWFKIELAAYYPKLKQPLQQLCMVMQCTIGFPQQIELLDIEESDLQPENSKKPSLLVFTTTIRNRAFVSQTYPALELTLTNAQNNVVARKVFLPKDYLGKDQLIQTGIAAKGEISARLNLDIGDLEAAGYRVYLFYP